MRRIFALVMIAIFSVGCATKVSLQPINFSGLVEGRLEGGRIYYAEASGNINTGAIIYKNQKPDSHGREIVVIASGVTKPFWQEIVLALIGAGGQVAAAGVYGLSIDAARFVVNQANSQTGGGAVATGEGGIGTGGVGIGGTSSATGGTSSAVTGPTTAVGGTSSATTGAINNDNTAVTGSSSSRSCSSGTTSGSTICPGP